ncbi:hypothetical protein V5N11_016976 [Cardamine amara subsp. amara]|uniref:DUF4216 domain-containing protein n=1 Tax=Cardamine amara subsp. amara TaxID=228776 RepID=A0ABD1B8T5_CARAN
MFHLKKKVKNLSKVEGSIVAQSLNEETSNFAQYYFAPNIQTKARRPGRFDDGGQRPFYHSYVPGIFQEIGRFSGKRKGIWLTEQEVSHIHTYILRNCEDILPYESIFANQAREAHADISDQALEEMKQELFAKWLKYYVQSGVTRDQHFPTWFEELVGGPLLQVVSAPMYCTRGYVFCRKARTRIRKTVNYGVVVKTPGLDYYGEITDILEVEYPGLVNLKCTILKCDWYDPTYGQGIKVTRFGVTIINSSRRLDKYDPFIIASQADQVCYLPFPRTSNVNDPWISVTQTNPRSRVEGTSYEEPLQQPFASMPNQTQASSSQVPLVNAENLQLEDLEVAADEEGSDEFAETSESGDSDYSSDSE